MRDQLASINARLISDIEKRATPKPRAGEHVPEGQFSGHTPGPWHWDCDPVKGDPTGRVRYRVCALGKTITQVYNSSFEGGPTNAEADARLIAFAPDLLAERDLLRKRERELVEALTKLADGIFDHLKAGTVRCDICEAVYKSARALLAKHGR